MNLRLAQFANRMHGPSLATAGNTRGRHLPVPCAGTVMDSCRATRWRRRGQPLEWLCPLLAVPTGKAFRIRSPPDRPGLRDERPCRLARQGGLMPSGGRRRILCRGHDSVILSWIPIVRAVPLSSERAESFLETVSAALGLDVLPLNGFREASIKYIVSQLAYIYL